MDEHIARAAWRNHPGRAQDRHSGEPNAGKSSLLNALARRDIAIVTEVAGTTRDVLSVDLSLADSQLNSSIRGLRETDELVERRVFGEPGRLSPMRSCPSAIGKPGSIRVDEARSGKGPRHSGRNPRSTALTKLGSIGCGTFFFHEDR
ncbi:hypothetical protein F2981_05840 [Sinorhizobium meliloti]|nr:hypothetical protein [Sinorhizobium meliloti]